MFVNRQIWTMAMQSYEICPTADGDVIFNGSSIGWISGYPILYFAIGQTRVVPYVKSERFCFLYLFFVVFVCVCVCESASACVRTCVSTVFAPRHITCPGIVCVSLQKC